MLVPSIKLSITEHTADRMLNLKATHYLDHSSTSQPNMGVVYLTCTGGGPGSGTNGGIDFCPR